jgi:NAD+ kinase
LKGDNNIDKFEPLELEDFHILNEVVIDRGLSPTMLALELYIDDILFTNISGDGVIISTPTGSTAYSMAAGGSIVFTNSECICITPLAPHSISFRPLILPISAKITIKKIKDGRSAAWISLDGATRFLMTEEESLII